MSATLFLTDPTSESDRRPYTGTHGLKGGYAGIDSLGLVGTLMAMCARGAWLVGFIKPRLN